jgi:hypothetical protein
MDIVTTVLEGSCNELQLFQQVYGHDGSFGYDWHTREVGCKTENFEN